VAFGTSVLGRRGLRAGASAAALCLASGLVHGQIEISLDPIVTTGPVEIRPEDLQANERAAALVAKPGTTMLSTEFGEAATAPAPPTLAPVDEEQIRQAAQDGAALIRLLGLVPSGRTVDPETEQDRELFAQEERARELLGDNPTVVYQVKIGEELLPDPMIVPWEYNATRLRDRFEMAVNLIAGNKLSEARAELLAISTEFPDSEWGVQAAALLTKLDNLKEGDQPIVRADAPVAPEITLDGPVRPTTILFDERNPAQSRVMILGRSYRTGDRIRQHPTHEVRAIRSTDIDIEVFRGNDSKVFTLSLRPSAGQ
jgi:hypothetical protein